MFAGISREDVLKIWLKAAGEFAQSQTPHVSAFVAITGQAEFNGEREEDLWLVAHVVEEIAGARATTNPDKVDAVLLRSRTVTSYVECSSEELLDECSKAGIIGVEEGKVRLNAIREAIQHRRRAFGLKGRGFYFD